ncbi:MAG: carboxy terminal-processing peptidase [Chthoniobacterales bacterium]|nr:carboxy terminal-processing peptidase [Chthoniobacterales bacterium]
MIPRKSLCGLFAALLLASSLPAPGSAEPKHDAKMGEVATTVARMLESAHYSRQQLNQEVAPGITQARRALDKYFDLLDYNRLFFTQQDIDEFTSRFGQSIQDDVMLGNLAPAYEIYDRFIQRVEGRVAEVKKALDQDFTFESKRTAQITRDKEPWPANEAAADKIWNARLEAELLQATLAEQAVEEAAAKKKKEGDLGKKDSAVSAPPLSAPKRTPKETVLKRYDRMLKSLHDETREDRASTFLVALAQSYDPHSEYMSQRNLDNFNIQMGLSLFGIGAELRSEDGYAQIQRLVPGGPAERNGELKANDRIIAVAQGEAGEFEDVVDMKLDKVVERIRGKKGTLVRLQVLPASSADPSKVEVVSIVRDEVKLKDEEAKAQVIDVKSDGDKTTKIGWITLPSFYANMDRQAGGAPKSTTRDVADLLKRLKREGIEGLIVDLRHDSGGSLDEAVRLTGLFIPRGPIVQAKDTNGNIAPMNDPDPDCLWDGPLIVLMNRLSASASEIFAAALQDYGRAVIVGDEQSFGKGTVQTLLEVDRFMPAFASSPEKSGAVKLTIQKFYRIKGGSTQLRGVNSDIILPSLTDQADFGEGSLKNPLDYDEVPARDFRATGDLTELIPHLRSASKDRASSDPEFAYVLQDRERLLKQKEENAVTLNKATRLSEIAEDKARRAARNDDRKKRGGPEFAALEVTLDTVDAPKLQRVALDKPPKRGSLEEGANDDDPAKPEDEIYTDAVRDETVRIMKDYIHPQGPSSITSKAVSAAP